MWAASFLAVGCGRSTGATGAAAAGGGGRPKTRTEAADASTGQDKPHSGAGGCSRHHERFSIEKRRVGSAARGPELCAGSRRARGRNAEIRKQRRAPHGRTK